MLGDTTPHVSFHVERLSLLVPLFSSHVKKIGIPFIRKSKLVIAVLALSSLLFIWDLPVERRGILGCPWQCKLGLCGCDQWLFIGGVLIQFGDA